MLENQLDVMS